MRTYLLVLAVIGCAEPVPIGEATARARPAWDVTINSDGTFDPPVLHIRDGDVVTWHFFDRTNAIIPVTRPVPDLPIAVPARTSGLVPKPYFANSVDPNGFAGPMPIAPGGIFALNPNPGDPGLAESPSACGGFENRGQVGGLRLCASAAGGAVMDATWNDPSITGVFLRLAWNDVNPQDGVYDWSALDLEIDKAVAHGKLYSVSVEAGADGTPDWIFSSGWYPVGHPRTGRVRRLTLQDQSSQPEHPERCGVEMDLGSPTDSEYAAYYFAMLRELATHLKQRVDRYRALAYIKPSGANLFTAENRLPSTCDPLAIGCICNTQVWSAAGYTSTELIRYYADQLDLLERDFPNKVMSYALIQAGFPLVSEYGDYAINTEVSPPVWSAPPAAIAFDAQTSAVIQDGVDDHASRFAVQHNGLQPVPALVPGETCPTATGCPNKWVTGSGATYTGFQTQNIREISSSALLDAALVNAKVNSTATFIEVFEERVWEARTVGGPLVPIIRGPGVSANATAVVAAPRTLADWDAYYRERRGPTPMTYSFTFYRTAVAGSQVFEYAESSKLATMNTGVIYLDP
jgi:hypothetical protein